MSTNLSRGGHSGPRVCALPRETGDALARILAILIGAAFLWALAVGVLVVVAKPSLAAVPPVSSKLKESDGHRADPVLSLTMGKAEIVTVEGAITDIMIADPKIADVVALQSNKLYIVGSSLGDTNIIALDKEGNVIKRLNVHVHIDTAAIEDMIHDLFPTEDVRVKMIGDQLALIGTVSTPTVSQKIARLVAAHMGEVQDQSATDVSALIENLLEVRGEQQVMLRVRIVEISRSVLKELGLETFANDPDEAGQLVFGRFPSEQNNGLEGLINTVRGTALTRDSIANGSLVWDSGVNGLGLVELALRALEQDDLANILAEPNLTAVSGEEAGFLAGGEFPVPVGRDREGNIIVEYKKFGVSLNFRPVVLSEDRISLQLNTEVSSLDFGAGITLAELEIPGLDVRRASTTVEINSGGSLMMAGLLKSNNVKGMAGLPGIKDTPILGDLISSRSFAREETELLVIVTPYLVKPFGDNTQAVPVMSQKQPEPVPTVQDNLLSASKKDAVMLEKVTIEPMTDKALRDRPLTPLTKVFSKNMRKIYGDRIGTLPDEKLNFGYMMD